MAPALDDWDSVLVVRRRGSHVRRGQVVVVDTRRLAGYPPGYPALMVKRATALAGESTEDGPSVPEGHLWLRGDRPVSLDSRGLGPFAHSAVVGVVILRIPAAALRRS